jgi:ABC-2 type transport system ATP-binding protein
MMIETQGLRKSFKSRRGEVRAVRGVDLTVREGEIFGFLGPNGAGKSAHCGGRLARTAKWSRDLLR